MYPFSEFLLVLYCYQGVNLHSLLRYFTLLGLFVASPCPLLAWLCGEKGEEQEEKGVKVDKIRHWAQEEIHRCHHTVSRVTWIAHATALCRNQITSCRDSPMVTGGHHYLKLKRKSLDQATGPKRYSWVQCLLGNVGVLPPLRPTASETGCSSLHTTHLCLSKPHRSFWCYSREWEPLNFFFYICIPTNCE